jgi:hypothetical protein
MNWLFEWVSSQHAYGPGIRRKPADRIKACVWLLLDRFFKAFGRPYQIGEMK